MKHIEIQTEAEFTAALKEHELCVVDFYKDNCPGCSMLTNTFKVLDESGQFPDLPLLKVKMENIGEDFFTAQGLRQTPTVKIYIDGEAVIMAPGFSSPSTMKSLIKQAQGSL